MTRSDHSGIPNLVRVWLFQWGWYSIERAQELRASLNSRVQLRIGPKLDASFSDSNGLGDDNSAAADARFYIANAARNWHPLAVTQKNKMMAAGPRMHLFNALEANDGGPADTEKIAGRKLPFERTHRFPQQMILGADVQNRVISIRLDPIDLFRCDKAGALAAAHSEALRGSGCAG